ncbi:MAG TPA: HlyD family efflux transporter periplasmic adaptor subunit [Candidatus Binatia bacterium]
MGIWGLVRVVRPARLPDGIASSNGRIEATEIDIATKIAGRIEAIFVDEGDYVSAGQVLAKMDTATLEAQLRQAKAQLQQAIVAVETAESIVAQRQAEKNAALALIAQRQAELEAARKNFERIDALAKSRVSSREELDEVRARYEGARAAVSAAEAQSAAADAAIGVAQSNVIQARAEVEAVQATIQRIQADIEDSTLRSPRDGRVQYRVAEPGEVLAAGGRVLNLVDLTDVYMTFFLPTAAAGRVAIGSEVRIVLDAIPQYVIPAKATFVSDVAQFTPKTVETEEERQKLTFRVKAKIPPELLRKYVEHVKTGVPGMAYVRLDPNVEWPPELAVRLPG